jgi:hypothetical protein
MKSNTWLTAAALSLSLGLAACGGGKPAPATNTTKPADNKTGSASKKAAPPKPTTAVKDSKKPEGGTAKTAKKVPVPDNWVYVYDEKKGYGFYLPEGSTGASETVEGIDVFVASTPAPAEIAVFVLAYKDSKRTKEDLLDDAVKFLEGLGETVKAGSLTAEGDDYALADATTTAEDGTKSKMKILVGTDVTDNYVMIVGTDEAKFDAHKNVIDEIWGNFEMWSGGASGNS